MRWIISLGIVGLVIIAVAALFGGRIRFEDGKAIVTKPSLENVIVEKRDGPNKVITITDPKTGQQAVVTIEKKDSASDVSKPSTSPTNRGNANWAEISSCLVGLGLTERKAPSDSGGDFWTTADNTAMLKKGLRAELFRQGKLGRAEACLNKKA